MTPDGVCECCGRAGSTWTTMVAGEEPRTVVPADPGPGIDPPLCDRCNYAQQCWDARQYELKHIGAGYPYADRPPVSPPIRRPGDRDLGPDGWPKSK
ncbi:hypothetical protein [Gemmata obscuriglobus]|uniref:Uncharacterized protein n=1 Tax=Gemmata obscuriglobus TaxID=114 RepID=A0A2Z3H4R7_9BACT|nr:hypothetical protein [Gemmata obscuriglobus]AWM41779.1 hypothetical protein C1280_35480 [Gemmata obscuriglobus]